MTCHNKCHRFSFHSLQLNQSQSSIAGLVEVLSGRRRLWALGEVAAIESGYRQALELKHSYPQVLYKVYNMYIQDFYVQAQITTLTFCFAMLHCNSFVKDNLAQIVPPSANKQIIYSSKSLCFSEWTMDALPIFSHVSLNMLCSMYLYVSK